MQLDKILKNVYANGQWNTTVEVIDIWIIRITKISAAAGIYVSTVLETLEGTLFEHT